MIPQILLSVLALSFVLLLIYLACTAAVSAGKPAPSRPGSFPSVTLLKPMKNIDDGLEENLESFFRQDYPGFRIIFGVDTLEDACVSVIEKVSRRYPQIETVIAQTGVSGSVNPKVDKLAKMSEGCASRLFWMTDSNTRVEKDALASLVAEYLKKNSKIVFSPIRGSGSLALGSMMANSYLNLFVTGNIISAWALAKTPIIVGKSMLIERETLEKLGGFQAFSCYLAEDYMMGRIYREKGIYISTNYTWVTNYSSSTSIGTFYARMSRWAKMRMRISPFFYSLEALANPVPLAALSLFLLGRDGLVLLGGAYLFKLAIEYANLILVNPADGKKLRVVCMYPLSVLLKDAVLAAVHIAAYFSRTVSWHGRTIEIRSKSMISNSSVRTK